MVTDRIKELLGLNLSSTIVAAATGVTDGYVTQLMMDAEFRREVQELRTKNLAEHAARDRKYDGLEDTLVARLEEMLETGMHFNSPASILQAIRVINGAKRRATVADLPASSAPSTVPLTLPVIFAPQIQINGTGQVIEVEGRTIATMPAAVVNKNLEKKQSPQVQKQIEEKQAQLLHEDAQRAQERLQQLRKMDALPVADLL